MARPALALAMALPLTASISFSISAGVRCYSAVGEAALIAIADLFALHLALALMLDFLPALALCLIEDFVEPIMSSIGILRRLFEGDIECALERDIGEGHLSDVVAAPGTAK